MSTLLKGRITEVAILSEFIRRDLPVLVPFGEGYSYDLAVDLGDDLLRIQCKTARPYPGGFIFNTRSTDHGNGAASYLGVAELFGVYFPRDDDVYLVPVPAVSDLTSGKAILRTAPTRNNQLAGIRFARDFTAHRWTNADLPSSHARLVAR